MNRFRTLAGVAVAIVLVDVVWLASDVPGSELGAVVATLGAAIVCWQAGRTLIGSGLIAWACAQGVWAFYDVPPFPSVADAGHLLFIACAAAAMLSSERETFDKHALLDAAIIATSVFAIGWNVLLGPIYRGLEGGTLANTVALAYPFGDLALVGIVLFAVGRRPRTHALQGLGFVSIAIAHAAFTYLTVQGGSAEVTGLAWSAGALLIALDVAVPETAAEPARKKSLVYAAAFVAVPLAMAKFFATNTWDPVLFMGMVSIFIVVAARQMVSAREDRARARELEITVQERTADLEQVLTQMREVSLQQEVFVAHLSHELFTPLTAIVGTMKVLAEPRAVSVQQMPLVEVAAESSQRMSQLVDDLMVATGLAGTVTYERVPFDLAEQVRAALAGVRLYYKSFEVDIPDGIKAVGDAERFRVALRHLVSNADKFAPPASVVRIDGSADGDRVSVTVRDEGPGIAPDFREAVFERFTRFNGAAIRTHEGLGLGLFLSRQVLQAMGGDVTIVDVPHGCAVQMELPSAEKRVAHFGRRSAAAAVATCLVLFSGSALAATGHLPAPLQDAIARVAKAVGLDEVIPTSDEVRLAGVLSAEGVDRAIPGLSRDEVEEFLEDWEEWRECVREDDDDDDEECGDRPRIWEYAGDTEVPLNTAGTSNGIGADPPDVANPGGSGGDHGVGDVSENVPDNASDNVPDGVGSAGNSGNAGDKVNDTTEDVEEVVEEPVAELDPVEEEVEEDLGDLTGGLGEGKNK